MPSTYLGGRNSLSILEIRILPVLALFREEWREEWRSSGELLGLAASPDSACPASSEHQEEVGAISQGRNPRGRAAIYTLDRPGAGRKQVSAKAEGKE